MLGKTSASPIKKNTARHFKRVSQFSHFEKPSNDDLISKLRSYRKQKMKASSIGKESYNQTEKILSSNFRPNSAGLANNIYSALRGQEMSPLKLTNSQVLLEQSVDRLYRGSRAVSQSSDAQKTPLFKLAEIVCEKKVSDIDRELRVKDEELSKALISELLYLKSLVFDLELNWEIARGTDNYQTEKKLGVYYSLQEKMKSKPELGPLTAISIDMIIEELQDCSRLFRDILRGVVSKGAEDEAIMLEMLWKVLIKIMDRCFGQHEFVLNSVIESSKSRLKSMFEESSNEIFSLNANLEKTKSDMQKQIGELAMQVKILQGEKADLSKMLHEKTRTLVELTEVESQEKACIELRGLLKKLSTYITESESEQTKQVTTLGHLSFMMKSADILKQKPELVDSCTETDWKIKESYLPELLLPTPSKYPLFQVFVKNAKVPTKFNAVTLCQSAWENCDGQLPFYKELIMFLLTIYKDKDSLITNLQGIYNQLIVEMTPSAKLFYLLLKNSKPSYIKVEQAIFKLSALFDKNCEDNCMSLLKFVEFLQGFLLDERNFAEDVLEVVTKGFNEKDYMNLVLYRLQITLEKVGKGLKGLLENDSLSGTDFADWARNKLGWWVNESEISAFIAVHQNLSLTSAIENPIYDKAKELKVEKDAFLFASSSILYEKAKALETKYRFVEEISDFHEYKEIVLKNFKEPQERKLLQSFTELFLATPYEEVIEKLFDCEQVDLKITEASKPKKKLPVAKKGKK